MAWHLLDRCIVFNVLLDNWSIHRHLLDNDIGPRLLELGASWSVLARGQGLRRLDRLGASWSALCAIAQERHEVTT